MRLDRLLLPGSFTVPLMVEMGCTVSVSTAGQEVCVGGGVRGQQVSDGGDGLHSQRLNCRARSVCVCVGGGGVRGNRSVMVEMGCTVSVSTVGQDAGRQEGDSRQVSDGEYGLHSQLRKRGCCVCLGGGGGGEWTGWRWCVLRPVSGL
jgi:hypothetical protein